MVDSRYKILSKINYPSDIKQLNIAELPELCKELRQYILEVISCNAGHLGSSLGAVELTVAIHYVFDTPNDNLIWDVGHQAYPHKILTGRKQEFDSIRTFGGISGFPKMTESEYDAFGTGHASTSISAALGMAIAAQRNGENEKHSIAVIGDGSMGGGMAFEAMNNAGATNANLLVVLNDNGIAIDKSVGAIKEYFLHMSMSKSYNDFRDKIWNILSGNEAKRRQRRMLRQVKSHVKASIFDEGNMFESLGMRYFGPTDGHDVIELVEILTKLKNLKGPKLLHCITVKGKGYLEAEKDQVRFHAPGTFDLETGNSTNEAKDLPPKYQDVFGETITKLAEENDKIIGITAAMPTGCSLNIMMEKFPERTFDVGIAEEHAVTFAAGLAAKGMKPYCAIYSTFLQRSYDQIIHDVALQKLPVVFCIDRAGLVGEDGPTHHGNFDLAYLRSIPNMIIAAPINEYDLQDMIYTAQFSELPYAIRYPRARGINQNWKKENFELIETGKGKILTQGKDIAVISIGHVGNEVIKALKMLEKENITPTHADIKFLKPIDETLLHEICKNHKKIITVEDGTIVGGLGTAVVEFISDNNYDCKVKRLGIPDRFIEQGSLSQLYKLCGIDAESIASEIMKMN
ncbi:1-deoxy-D-xylulose-5-phosphate synthase [Bacteroidales bacterium OttesenSCG-928-K03]|nr:1-deoxy-D-xylulose-5-phosphate synthase [Odoribacter sp. OttesenSCG-928-L07]MDL2239791.1 1-deoxy-D-xylulose-5-phosphate synthase [Bacteroidales bacterium OttesenSCG-928-L14]MDL2240424.1 1-deoxy-D-xylulose-5-phosphate synthase [Bacteroidales bacterium OttesenSCG-928-K22]MDL2243005.1 1-deoxy-D-xylulose-5-phosphate synthase [Bacteroidales bacterium OttesenSCG-928-K03]